jgi:hypothetical protein
MDKMTKFVEDIGNKKMKVTKPARALSKLIAFIMLGWIGYVIYCTFAETGIWRYVVQLDIKVETFMSADPGYTPMLDFCISLIVGLLPLLVILLFILRLSNRTNRTP